MGLFLTDEQAELLLSELDQIIEKDRYLRRASRVREIREPTILATAASPANKTLRGAQQRQDATLGSSTAADVRLVV